MLKREEFEEEVLSKMIKQERSVDKTSNLSIKWYPLSSKSTKLSSEIPKEPRKVRLHVVSNNCLDCQRAFVRERKLRERLKIAEAFIHTMNHNLEIDAVSISDKMKKKAQVMEEIQKKNLSLLEEKNEKESKLLDYEAMMHEMKIKLVKLEAENKTLKEVLTSNLRTSSVTSSPPHVMPPHSYSPPQSERTVNQSNPINHGNIAPIQEHFLSSTPNNNILLMNISNNEYNQEKLHVPCKVKLSGQVDSTESIEYHEYFKPTITSTPRKVKHPESESDKCSFSKYLTQSPDKPYEAPIQSKEYDVSYIMNLKEQTSAVKNQLQNIQNIVSNIKEFQ